MHGHMKISVYVYMYVHARNLLAIYYLTLYLDNEHFKVLQRSLNFYLKFKGR